MQSPEAVETRLYKVVFPDITNHHNTMFGGEVIVMMTETAFLTATRSCRKSFVIVSIDKIDFNKPIPAGTIVELVGNVEKIGNTSIKIKVDVYLEQMTSRGSEKVVSGTFTFVALDENNQPEKIIN